MKISMISKSKFGYTSNDDGTKTFTFCVYSDEGKQEIEMSEGEYRQLKELMAECDY